MENLSLFLSHIIWFSKMSISLDKTDSRTGIVAQWAKLPFRMPGSSLGCSASDSFLLMCLGKQKTA